jgi:hypothetical protein
MADITTRTIGPGFDGEDAPAEELTIEQQLEREAELAAAENIDLPVAVPQFTEETGPSESDEPMPSVVSGAFAAIRVLAFTELAGPLDLVLTVSEAVQLRDSLDTSILQATEGQS